MKEVTFKSNSKLDFESIRSEKLKRLSNNRIIDSFLKENNLKLEDISSLSLLEEYLDNCLKCQNCHGLNECINEIKGQRMTIEYNGMIYPLKEYCNYYRDREINNSFLKNIIYNDIPFNLRNITLESIKPDMHNPDSVNLYVLLNKILNNELDKGLYIYGSFGTGKTYMSIALVNSLAKASKKCAFVKVNDFINKLRKLVINDNLEMERIVDDLKEVDYLVLDDIGAESMSGFVRDDILFNILDYRMENKLITIFTSNHTMKTLREAFIYDKNNNKDTLKGERLLERVRVLTYEQHLGGVNLRK